MRKIYFLLVCLFVFLNLNAQSPILQESFESATFPPTGWVIQNNGSGNNWSKDTIVADAKNGTKCMRYVYNTTNAANAWAYTPLLNLNTSQLAY